MMKQKEHQAIQKVESAGGNVMRYGFLGNDGELGNGGIHMQNIVAKIEVLG